MTEQKTGIEKFKQRLMGYVASMGKYNLLKEVLESLLNRVDFDEINTFYDLSEKARQEACEVARFSDYKTAMQYLMENDPILNLSLQLVDSRTLQTLDSMQLASALKVFKIQEYWHEEMADIKQMFDECEIQ